MTDNFANKKEASAALKYWKTQLGLRDWFIKLRFTEGAFGDNKNNTGFCDFDFSNKSALITIANLNEYERGNLVIKQPQEQVLIHELLHCLYPIKYKNEEINSEIVSELQHQVLEQIAKTLFAEKYKLNINWFNNK